MVITFKKKKKTFNTGILIKKLNRKNKYLDSAGHHKKHTIDKCEINQAFSKEKILLIL